MSRSIFDAMDGSQQDELRYRMTRRRNIGANSGLAPIIPGATTAVVFLLTAVSVGAEPPFTATPMETLHWRASPAMRMPTDVAVAPDGSVFVADGVNDRVLAFSPEGTPREEIRSFGEEKLSRPTGVAVDGHGRLWIADTGHARVLARTPDGRLDRVIDAGTDGEHPADITDVAINSDGTVAWLVDNDNHQVIRHDLDSGRQRRFGAEGESIGQLNHPFLIAPGVGQSVLVTDVINGRVARFTKTGQPGSAISAYGVEPGHAYRPKGVAMDSLGNVWLSDGTIGVIQAFDANGGFLDVLRGPDGDPVHFESPMGIAFDASGNLYVTELLADRVQKLRIARAEPRRDAAAPPPQKITGQQARGCTVCHYEWMEPFPQGLGTLIAKVPPGSQQAPTVSRSEMCLSCHDGSVQDSRRRVWQEHGHQTGTAPPPSMRVPPHLPLSDGQISCRTCHSAHASGQFSADFRTAVFLRVQNVASELCIGCHQDKTRGPEFGTHPVGGMPWAIPKALVDAGAKIGPNPRELTCQVCHTPHGSREDHLLVMGTSSNELCTTCHEQMRPGMFRDDSHTEHPLRPIVSPEQAAVVKSMGTKLGPNQELICLSCHKLHHGQSGRFMLADDLTDGRFCMSCHAGKSSVLDTSHDLRTNFPEEKNRLGMTASSGGPCSACHMFHRYARAPEPSDIDPGGKCITCHQRDRCASAKVLGSANHPGARCVDCHNPHSERHPPYLAASTDALCGKCHQPQTALAGGPHDFRRATAAWPDAARRRKDECLACHRPHGTDETGLFQFAGAAGGADAGCRACHSSHRWDVAGDSAALHPREIPPDSPHGNLPLVAERNGASASIGCKTCHDPHADFAANPSMLRLGGDASLNSLCATCHADTRALALTGHGSAGLAAAGLDARACGPCHVVHGDRNDVAPDRLWSSRLAAAHGADSTGDRGPGAYCRDCHRPGGAAPLPKETTHPDVVMSAVAAIETNGSLPLFDERGERSSTGSITCRTCHLPHGRAIAEKDVAYLAGASPQQRRAARLLLRPFEPPNICTTCHGADALRRYLYFHDRHGKIASPVAIRAGEAGD